MPAKSEIVEQTPKSEVHKNEVDPFSLLSTEDKLAIIAKPQRDRTRDEQSMYNRIVKEYASNGFQSGFETGVQFAEDSLVRDIVILLFKGVTKGMKPTKGGMADDIMVNGLHALGADVDNIVANLAAKVKASIIALVVNADAGGSVTYSSPGFAYPLPAIALDKYYLRYAGKAALNDTACASAH